MEQYVVIAIREGTKKMLCEQCKKEFLRHHPELNGTLISNDKIVKEVCKFYLEN